jgi:SAM-dependent methyltransferase
MNPTTTDDLLDLMDGYLTSAAFNAALELGLFWRLAEGSLELREIAEAFEIPAFRCRYWLELLLGVGLIMEDRDRYALTEIARETIVGAFSQETWSFLAREARDRFPAIRDLGLTLKQPGSAWVSHRWTMPDFFTQIRASATRAREFTRMLYEIHMPLAVAIADNLDLTGVSRFIDLGGGSGAVSLALLNQYPGSNAVVVDIPKVCEAGREITQQQGYGDRIHYYEADILADQLPTGFDLALDCDFNGKSEALFQKIRSSLNPDGRLVIVRHFASAGGHAPGAWKFWSFLASLQNPSFSLPTIEEIRRRLERSGYQILSTQPLPRSDVGRWSRDWIKLEARVDNL